MAATFRYARFDVIEGLLVDRAMRPVNPAAHARRQLAIYEPRMRWYDPLCAMGLCLKELARRDTPDDVRAAWGEFYRDAQARRRSIAPRLP